MLELACKCYSNNTLSEAENVEPIYIKDFVVKQNNKHSNLNDYGLV